MKTAILQVEAYDDVASLHDKIIGSRSERILLILPRQKRVFPGRLEMNLLARWAKENGAVFAIVSRSGIAREYAESLGIPVFGSIPEAQKGEWRLANESIDRVTRFRGKEGVTKMRDGLPKPGVAEAPHPVLRVLMIALSFLAIIALMIFLIPSASIVVYPQPETQTVTMDIRASTEISQTSIAGLLPAMEETISVSGQKTIVSSGSTPIGIEKARGEVTVRNLFTEALEIPEGATFATGGEENLRFIATAGVILSPDSKQTVIPVEAILPGVESNIDPGMISLLEGGNGLKVEVTNETSITGGVSTIVNSPTESDYILARTMLLNELEEKALRVIETSPGQEKTTIPGSLKFTGVESENRENPVGVPSDTLTLNLIASYELLVYDTAALSTLVEDVLNLSIPEGYHDAETSSSSLDISEITVDPGGEARWQITASRQIIKDISKQHLAAILSGRKKSEVIKSLNDEIPHVKGAQVQPFIKWWPWLPLFTARINLVEGMGN